MKQENGIGNWLFLCGKELLKGVLAFGCSRIGVLGCYPLLPAFFALCSVEKKASIPVTIGSFVGAFLMMPVHTMMKYVFILLIIGCGARLFSWVNNNSNVVTVGIIATITTIVMSFAESAFSDLDTRKILIDVSEGLVVLGIVLCGQAIRSIPFHISEALSNRENSETLVLAPITGNQVERIESLKDAVNSLSDAFFAISQPKEKLVTDEVSLLEQELTGRMCASCDVCAICWNENRMKSQGGIRALLHAVVNQCSKEELLQFLYVNNCKKYPDMVDAALQAFSRLELNHAWYQRLQDNRYMVAQQLDAMADLMEEWAKARKDVDRLYKSKRTQLLFEVKEKGLIAEDLHLYEENQRLCVEAVISCKWEGGIPIKRYVTAVEKVLRRPMRIGKGTKSVLTKEKNLIQLYEDTAFYTLQGIAMEKKNGSLVSGDNFSFFSMDDGRFHICLSDGMGSGNRAKQESEMVVDLLQKFIEAGFSKETAIKLMNSAMVLQGENNIYSTLDYATIDLYDGTMELVKIGGATTFIKRGEEVECIEEGTLPTGVDIRMEIESTKKQLQSGDFLVMVTDGVIEYLHVREPQNTMADIISMARGDNAGVLAQTILDQVMQRTGGYAMDDMTVLVTGIWEK